MKVDLFLSIMFGTDRIAGEQGDHVAARLALKIGSVERLLG